ncbi:hypothetical protein ABW02_16145 [Niallia circulans]|uniref:Uncharacterized protein n=1 Tax=Niallia circulans TaxID=1397 RepID=A0A0J1IHX8_NIACI|nr:hypothetical protein ABW02_16145 [Niallia circulans]
MKVKEGGSIHIITIKFENNCRKVFNFWFSIWHYTTFRCLCHYGKLGLAKEKAQGFAAAERIGMLISGGLAVALSAFGENHTKIIMTVCLLNFCYDNTVRSTIS